MMLYLMKFAKKAKIKIKFQKNEGYFFGQHPLDEKSPTGVANNNFYFKKILRRHYRMID